MCGLQAAAPAETLLGHGVAMGGSFLQGLSPGALQMLQMGLCSTLNLHGLQVPAALPWSLLWAAGNSQIQHMEHLLSAGPVGIQQEVMVLNQRK